MSILITDVSGDRSIEVEGGNRLLPESVFITTSMGDCYEFNRIDLIRALKKEFDLLEPLEIGLERLLSAA